MGGRSLGIDWRYGSLVMSRRRVVAANRIKRTMCQEAWLRIPSDRVITLNRSPVTWQKKSIRGWAHRICAYTILYGREGSAANIIIEGLRALQAANIQATNVC